MTLPVRHARDRLSRTAMLASVVMVTAMPAHAAGSSMPWEEPLQQILESIVTGLTLAFGDTGGGFRKLIQIVFGLSIAFAASSFFLSFFSFGGGALV
jgi:type IV secretion system protein TrbC